MLPYPKGYGRLEWAHLENADTSDAMTYNEHDSSYTNAMEMQEDPDSQVLPNVSFSWTGSQDKFKGCPSS